MSFLQNLKKQPAAVRTQVAFWTALSVSGAVAMVWFTTLPARFADVDMAVNQATEESARIDARFTDFKNQVGAAGGAVEDETERETVERDGATSSSSETGATTTTPAARTILIATSTAPTP